jgi:hypothetical protein
MIRQVVPQGRAVWRILERAAAHQESDRATLIAVLAMREFGTSPPEAAPFSSAGEALQLFESRTVEQTSVNLFNGRVASAFAGDSQTILARIARGFREGELLALPRDAARLHSHEVMNALPAALAFLLAGVQEERKAFTGYLRRGTPPLVSSSARLAIAQARPVLRSWEYEAQ